MIKIPQDASAETQQAFRDVWSHLERLPGLGQEGVVDFQGRRITNASPSVAPFDLVTRQELTRLNTFETTPSGDSASGLKDVESGSGLIMRLDGTEDIVGQRRVRSSWNFTGSLQADRLGVGVAAPSTSGYAQVNTRLGIGTSPSVPLDVSGDINGDAQIEIAGTGPHVVGGATVGNYQMRVTGAYSFAGSIRGLRVDSTLTPGVNGTAALFEVNGSIVEQSSGTHPDLGAVSISSPSITPGAAAVTRAWTLRVLDAPTAGTNNYAVWVDSGLVRWDDPIALGGGAAPTLGTIGGSGPATAAQNQWLRVDINGTTNFIPVWQ